MQCHLVDGKHDRALDLLEQAMGSLHFLQEWSRLDPLPWWDPVKDNPRYIELTDRLESLLAEQRAIFEEIEAADVSVQ
jgi:hypothetical protein